MPARGALPNLIVIGAAKAGTTSLHHYLDLHPEIGMAREKELHFFSRDDDWRRGPGWYASRFDGRLPVRGEASVTYTAFPRYRSVPSRMASLIPEARLVYLVRDPIERVISAYVHRVSERIEERSLPDALVELEGNDLVERSRYWHQLEQFLAHYPMERIHILTSEALRRHRRRTLAELYHFLGVDPEFDSPELDVVKHESSLKRRKSRLAITLGRLATTAPARVLSPDLRRRIGYWVYRPLSGALERPELDAETRARLAEWLAPDVEELRARTGHAFADWSL